MRLVLSSGLCAIALLFAGQIMTRVESAPTAHAQSEPTAPAPPSKDDEPPSTETVHPSAIQAVLGREVRSAAGESMGRIADVVVDLSGGQVRSAVIDFGGFLGVGTRKIAVEWSLLRFGSGPKSDQIVVDLTRNQVKAAPEYKAGKPIVILGPAAPAAESEKAN